MASDKPSQRPAKSDPGRDRRRVDEDEQPVEGYRDASVYEEEKGEPAEEAASARRQVSTNNASSHDPRRGKAPK
jgi:hypothetical protein